MQRKLTAILSADVVGYSGLMEADEAGTLQRLKANRSGVFDPLVAKHGGRQFKLMGDGALVEFSSVISAIECALAIQAASDGVKDGIRYRIGINLGEVIVEGDDIYGEGVNIAARLQTLAAPGGVTVSRMVRDSAEGKLAGVFEDMGEHAVKNLDRPLHVFAVRVAGDSVENARMDDRGKVSICVLPFVNMSGEAEQEYFSDGISEDIITDLSKVSALGVIARNTAFQFKGKNVDVPHVARQLKVSHVLEGSVRKAGGRVRITAQLINGASGEHVWADRFDRDLNDIFALQDEISQAIVGALKLKLLPEEKRAIAQRGTGNVEAYELLLLARQFHRTGSERMKPLILRLCQRAVALDPNFALAWALMAAAEAEGFQRQVPGFSFENAKTSAERAVALAPQMAEAHAALGEVLLRAGLDTVASQNAVETALKLDPNCYEAQMFGGYLYMAQHRLDECIKHFEAAVALEPDTYQAAGMVLQAYYTVGDREKLRVAAQRAFELCEKILKVEPDHGGALGFIVGALVHMGDKERAREWAKRALLFDPDNLRMHYNVACSMATMGDTETAIAMLSELLPKAHGGWVSWMRSDTDLDPIRDDPRFVALIETAEARVEAELKGGAL